MLICDRCNKQASQNFNLIPDHGTDLCGPCVKDFKDLVQAFLAASDFKVSAPDIAKPAPPPDEISSVNVVVIDG